MGKRAFPSLDKRLGRERVEILERIAQGESDLAVPVDAIETIFDAAIAFMPHGSWTEEEREDVYGVAEEAARDALRDQTRRRTKSIANHLRNVMQYAVKRHLADQRSALAEIHAEKKQWDSRGIDRRHKPRRDVIGLRDREDEQVLAPTAATEPVSRLIHLGRDEIAQAAKRRQDEAEQREFIGLLMEAGPWRLGDDPVQFSGAYRRRREEFRSRSIDALTGVFGMGALAAEAERTARWMRDEESRGTVVPVDGPPDPLDRNRHEFRVWDASGRAQSIWATHKELETYLTWQRRGELATLLGVTGPRDQRASRLPPRVLPLQAIYAMASDRERALYDALHTRRGEHGKIGIATLAQQWGEPRSRLMREAQNIKERFETVALEIQRETDAREAERAPLPEKRAFDPDPPEPIDLRKARQGRERGLRTAKRFLDGAA